MATSKSARRPPRAQAGFVTIYCLADPRDPSIPRYIGATCLPLTARRGLHLSDAQRDSRRKVCRWVAALVDDGIVPLIREIEVVPDSVWEFAERRWIAHYRQASNSLLNVANGGRGAEGNRHSAATRRLMSERAIAEGRKPPGNLGRIFGPEWIANLSAAHKGQSRSHTAESRAKMSAAAVGRTWSPEMRKRLSDAHQGQQIPNEQRAKISSSMKLIWARRKAGELPDVRRPGRCRNSSS